MDSADASRYKDRYRKMELQSDGVTDRTKASYDQSDQKKMEWRGYFVPSMDMKMYPRRRGE